ncbi:MAG: ABC transporter permease [Acidimicrobiia bacterium]|nr:ABC transporter permease [Acidimicrobiia bacterium]
MSHDVFTEVEQPSIVPEEFVPVAFFEESGSGIGGFLKSLIAPTIIFAAFMGVWYLLSWRYLPIVMGRDSPPEFLRSIILPYPHDVVSVAFLDSGNLGEILSGFWLDMRLAFTGLAIAMVLGISTAIAMSQARWVERSFYPYAVFLQTVPILALVPVIGLFLGFGFTSRVVVVVIISLFPIITNTLFGLKSVDPGLDDMFTLHTKSRRVRLWKLQLPGSLPAMFVGFQIAAGLSVVGAIVGDFFFARGEKGLGNLISIYSNRLQPEQLWGTVFFSTLLGLFVFTMFGWLRTRLVGHWHESANAR